MIPPRALFAALLRRAAGLGAGLRAAPRDDAFLPPPDREDRDMDRFPTPDPDYPAGDHPARPSVMDAARAVDADDRQRVLSLRASTLAVVLQRCRAEGRFPPVAADIDDYESCLRILERPAP